jgi:hypothetical protein
VVTKEFVFLLLHEFECSLGNFCRKESILLISFNIASNVFEVIETFSVENRVVLGA